MGAAVPDLRGMFLRGTGGNAGALGQAQIDTMRPVKWSAEATGTTATPFAGISSALATEGLRLTNGVSAIAYNRPNSWGLQRWKAILHYGDRTFLVSRRAR